MSESLSHDPWCPWDEDAPTSVCQCALIAKVRADAVHKVETEGTDITRWHQGLVLTYLRAQVAALPSVRWKSPGWVLRADVLDLIDRSAS